jgi:hypothetical protein
MIPARYHPDLSLLHRCLACGKTAVADTVAMYMARTRGYLEKGGFMTRKDSDKDADRPHYYSQFWLDIAAGRRVIGGPKPEEAETSAGEAPEPASSRKTGRSGADGYRETQASVAAEPVVEEAVEEEEEEEFEQEETVEQPDIDFGEELESEEEPLDDEVMAELESEDGVIEDAVVEEEFEPEEEDFFDEEEEEEEDWGRHGRKKPKPGRQAKPPAKKPRRETRRGF